jgi:hypothetical protein
MSHAFAFKESDHLSETESGESSDWFRLLISGRTLRGDVMSERSTHTSAEVSLALVSAVHVAARPGPCTEQE